ncbi:solute carrier family 50 (sugar transporter) [Strigomonas culicis]|nr:solute carrier family 50 (sugar transporter) [Strigomonas culicis]|eukprot:EPY32380.1 solute carrier family 50 (sugar transporter) [Strigomonas culicis]
MNASPVVTVRRLVQAGSIGPSTVTFYGAQLFSGVTWCSYAVYADSIPILISSGVGNAVSTYCMLTFLSVARVEERSGKRLIATTYAKSVLTAGLFVLLGWAHLAMSILLVLHGRSSVAYYVTGWEASVASVVMLSAPMAMFPHIIRNKDASSLAPLTILFGLGNTVGWTIAGIMKFDIFILMTNLLCALACAAQMALYLRYGTKQKAEPEVVHEAIADVPFD